MNTKMATINRTYTMDMGIKKIFKAFAYMIVYYI